MSVNPIPSSPSLPFPNERLTIDVPAADAKGEERRLHMFAEGDDSPSFWDVLDIINPLQHIPIVNTIYRELTGDQIGVGARLLGGTLFGGPVGLIAAAVGSVVEEATGKDPGGHVMALFKDEDQAPATAQPKLAQGQAEAQPQAEPSPTSSVAPPVPEAAPRPAVAVADALPAKAEAKAEAAAPAATTGGPLVFGADGGMVQPEVPPLRAQAAAPRFMPVPERTVALNHRPPPPVTVPVSINSQRSNVPITGRQLSAPLSPDPAAVQRILAQQGLTGVQHPMVPEAPAKATPAAAQAAPLSILPQASPAAAGPAGDQDWFAASVFSAMDKYQRSSKLGQQEAPGSTLVQ